MDITTSGVEVYTNLKVDATTTLASSLTGFLKGASGVVSAGGIGVPDLPASIQTITGVPANSVAIGNGTSGLTYDPYLYLAGSGQLVSTTSVNTGALYLGNGSNIYSAGTPVINVKPALTAFSGVVTLAGSGGGTPATLTNLGYQTYSTIDGYYQNNIQNLSTGTSASSDWVATANDGTDVTNYIDMGINGSGFSSASWTINGARDGYIYTQSTNLALGTATAAKSIVLFTGGTLAANARVTVADAGTTFSTPITMSGSSSFNMGTGTINAGSGGILTSGGGNISSNGSVSAATDITTTGGKVQGVSVSQTVQSVAVSTTPAVNLANGGNVVLGASGVPGALTAATTITFSNPVIGSTTRLMFQQGTTSFAVTFTISGFTFYRSGKTAGIASGSVVLAAADMTLSQYNMVEITWLTSTKAFVALIKT
jgi:hypothetical protein